MKATIIEQKVYEGAMDYIHNGGRLIKRLFIEDLKLCITPDEDTVYIFDEYQPDDDSVIIGETDIADELVKEALAVASAQKELQKKILKIADALPDYS